MNNEFSIIFSCDTGYEDLCAEIYYLDQFVAIIDQELGSTNMRIEIHKSQSSDRWNFKLTDFLAILKDAEYELLRRRKFSE
jgi:hypothetical protein